MDATDRRYIDDQIIALSKRVITGLARGQIRSAFTLDAHSAELAAGDVFCAAGAAGGAADEGRPETAVRLVTRATSDALAVAGVPLGIATEACAPGGIFTGAIDGLIGPGLTGLAAIAGPVRVSDARCVREASLGEGDMQIGFADDAGNLSFARTVIGAGGSGGGSDLTAPTSKQAGGITFGTYTSSGDLDYLVGPASADNVLAWDTVNGVPVWTPRAGLAVLSFAATTTLVETSQVVSTPTFTASFTGTPTGLTLTNTADSEAKDVHATPTSFSSSNAFQKNTPNQSVTFTITATLAHLTATASSTVTWAQKNFWGLSTTPANTETFIEALSSSQLKTTAAASFTLNASGSNKIYFAHPTRYGTPTFTVGGFAGGFTLRSSAISVTNAQGFTENYSLWESDNAGLGSTTVSVS
jgi:hypothetical protein